MTYCREKEDMSAMEAMELYMRVIREEARQSVEKLERLAGPPESDREKPWDFLRLFRPFSRIAASLR